MIWDVYHTEGSTDSWIWEVNESQYGGGGDGNTVTENDTAVMDESRYGGDSDSTATENGTEDMDESQYDDDLLLRTTQRKGFTRLVRLVR